MEVEVMSTLAHVSAPLWWPWTLVPCVSSPVVALDSRPLWWPWNAWLEKRCLLMAHAALARPFSDSSCSGGLATGWLGGAAMAQLTHNLLMLLPSP
ncbi:hypothetical protein V8C86DRAFT_2537288 [Haematococcus lacustris]